MSEAQHIPELGPLEHALLRILWTTGPATARDVLDRYNAGSDRSIAYTTVMTLLTRMVEKGALTVDRSRQPFVFQPAVSRDRMIRQRIREFVNQFFDGSAVDLAVRLVEETPLTESEVQRLEAMIEEHRARPSTDLVRPDSGEGGGP